MSEDVPDRLRDADLPRPLQDLVREWEIMYYGNYDPMPIFLDGRDGQLYFGRQYVWTFTVRYNRWHHPDAEGEVSR